MENTGKQERRYYVGGRCYCPDVSTPICCHEGIFERVTLYQSPKGAFFTEKKAWLTGWGLTAQRRRYLARPPPGHSWTDTPPGLTQRIITGFLENPKRDNREAGREAVRMATGQPTNEELTERLQAAGQGSPEAAEIMGELWARNAGLVRLIVHKVTGLNQQEPGFEDMEQQAYFGFHAAACAYTPDTGVKFSTYATKRIKWELCRY